MLSVLLSIQRNMSIDGRDTLPTDNNDNTVRSVMLSQPLLRSRTHKHTIATIGGFECYIISDTVEGDATAAAEVYKADGDGEDADPEESLLSVSPGGNVLNLVMRDQGIMR
jgi:Oxoglutarate and iron-dependent oxygenase degradation C-term